MKHALALTAVVATPVLFLISSARAAEVSVTSTAPLTSIEEGRLKLGGGVDFTYGDRQKGVLSISPMAEYFVSDRLSLGGTFNLSQTFGEGLSYWSIGPSATYYFLKQDRWAAYFSQSLTYSRVAGSGPDPLHLGAFVSTSKLGVEYFLTRSVSFGPAFQWRHTFADLADSLRLPSQNTYSLVGQFSIYF